MPPLPIAGLKLALGIFRDVWGFFKKFILRLISEPLKLCGTVVGKHCSKQMPWWLIKIERFSEPTISSTNASVLYSVGTRFGSQWRPRFPDRFILIFFSPSSRMRVYYFTLDNARDFQAISNALFIGRHIFRLYKAWGAEGVVKLT
jgi:hypothetical protein